MIVLDFLKVMANDTLLIPPFHTGHLGLLPSTEVKVGLVNVPPTREPHCELLVTPYEPSSSMAHIHCIMVDRPGVVHRLVEAVSLLGINIVTEESSAMDSLNNHSIDLLIDWSSSNFARSTASDPSQISRYAEWQGLFPIREARYIKLFESIMAHCADLLVTEQTGRVIMPRLAITPLAVQSEHAQSSSHIEKDTDHQYFAKLVVPPRIMGELRNRLGTKPEDPLHYLVLSETEDRTLRVFFPRPGLVPRILHVGFYHRDIPRALSKITQMLASDFNILTSLLRKTSPLRSVWEAILEYRGKDPLPAGDLSQTIAWLAEKLTQRAAQDKIPLERYGLELGSALYPPPRKDIPRLPISGAGQGSSEELVLTQEEIDKEIGVRLDQARAALARQSKVMNRVFSAVLDGIQRNKKSVFISFPKIARKYADLLVKALKESGEYEPVIYEARGAEHITDAVVGAINRSDYFVGIWHHDERLPTGHLPTGENTYGISPWMPFEYGIAYSLGKPSLVVHSNLLDHQIWNRINPGIGNPEYTDVGFAAETVPSITARLRDFR